MLFSHVVSHAINQLYKPTYEKSSDYAHKNDIELGDYMMNCDVIGNANPT